MSVSNKLSTHATLFALARRLHLDSQLDPGYLQQRDEIAAGKLPHVPPTAFHIIRAWVQALDGESLAIFETSIRWYYRSLVALGFLCGIVSSFGLISLDYPQPINIFAVGTLLILLPLALLCLSLLFVLPASLLKWIPGYSYISEALSAVHIQRVVEWAIAKLRLEQSREVAWKLLKGSGEYLPWRAWYIFLSGQLFALYFSTGVLIVLLVCVTFTDLAFVWSTTLTIETQTLYEFLQLFCWPWRVVVPEAVPSFELIEHTRYYRLQSAVVAPERYGAWWPFFTMAVVSYGVMLRLLFLLFAIWGARRSAQRLALSLPGVETTLLRLSLGELRTAGEPQPEAEAEQKTREQFCSSESHVGQWIPNELQMVIIWASTDSTTFLSRLRADFPESNFELSLAGGRKSLAEDSALLAALAEKRSNVAFLVRAWEPPTREILDFIQKAFAVTGGRLTVVLLPLESRRIGDLQKSVWRRSLPAEIPLRAYEREGDLE